MTYVPLKLQVILIFIGKKHFHRIPKYFRTIVDFEADNEIDYSSLGNETI